MRLWRHMRALWPHYTLLPPLPFVAWAVYALARGELRWELIALIFVAPLLAYTSRASKALFVGIFPVALVGLLYDGMRFVKYVGVTADDVHVCDLHDLDRALLGIPTATGRVSLSDWFYGHSSTALDLLCAVPYGTFIFVALGYAIYLYVRDPLGLRRFAWTFLLVNVAGFITYHIYPAAPPWYFHTHGCAVDLAAHASEGARLAHVDAILGTPYFGGMYGRSNDVFGAMPSLHVAYPSLILFEAWRHHRFLGRALAAAFLVNMVFAAVYLDHHWALDVVAGLTYAVISYAIVDRVTRWWERRSPRMPIRSPKDDVALASQEAE